MELGIRIWDPDSGLDMGSGLKLVYRLKITFEFEVYWIGCGDAGLLRKYNQLNLKILCSGLGASMHNEFQTKIFTNRYNQIHLKLSKVCSSEHHH